MRLSIRITGKHRQFPDTVHGGVVASLADSAAAWAIYGANLEEFLSRLK